MRDAILEALRPLRPDSQRQVVLITDGYIGFEQEIVAAILDGLPAQCRVHTIGVGSAPNRSLTAAAARAGAGVELAIALDEDAEPLAKRLLARTSEPLVTELVIEGAAVLDTAPARLPDLFAGAPVLVSLALRPEGGAVRVHGAMAGGARFEQAIDAPAHVLGEGQQAVAALYGRERVEDLEARAASPRPPAPWRPSRCCPASHWGRPVLTTRHAPARLRPLARHLHRPRKKRYRASPRQRCPLGPRSRGPRACASTSAPRCARWCSGWSSWRSCLPWCSACGGCSARAARAGIRSRHHRCPRTGRRLIPSLPAATTAERPEYSTTVTETDDAAYLPRIAAGDTAAFGAWMTSAERPVRDSLRSFAGRVDTESVIQETFLRVWQVAPSIVSDGKPNNLVRVALRIARNLAISETRRLRTAAAYGEELEGLEGLDALGHGSSRPPDPMLRRLIAACRERLPEKPAQALTARLQNEGSDADATLAEQLGMTKNTFLQNFTRARKLLAQCLTENGVDLDAELT